MSKKKELDVNEIDALIGTVTPDVVNEAEVLYSIYTAEVGNKSVKGDDLPTFQKLIEDDSKVAVVNGWIAMAARSLSTRTTPAESEQPFEAVQLSAGEKAHEEERLKTDLAVAGSLQNIYYSFLILQVVVTQIEKLAPKSILLQKVVKQLDNLVKELQGLLGDKS